MDENNEPQEEGYLYFRHNMIARFKVGKYEFTNHLLTVKEGDLEDFMKRVDGLMPIDRNSITQVMNIRNERPISELRQSRVLRGPADTGKITDPTKINPAGQESNPESSEPARNPSILNVLGKNAGQGPQT